MFFYIENGQFQTMMSAAKLYIDFIWDENPLLAKPKSDSVIEERFHLKF